MMSTMKFRRSKLFLLLIFLPLIFLFFILSHLPTQTSKSSSVTFDFDEEIDLIELFQESFRLIYQSGSAIKSFKNTKKKYRSLRGKQSIDNQTIEPVTLADLLSHSILTDGLKRRFPHLQVILVSLAIIGFSLELFLQMISEEKNSFDHEEIENLKKEFFRPNRSIKVPKIAEDRHLKNIPLSSVAVWIDPLDATQEFTGLSSTLDNFS